MSDIEFDGVLEDLEGTDTKVLREQIERAHQINQLAEHPAWSVFCDYLTALTVTSQRRILGGYCQTMEQYREQTGYVSGLQKAITAPRDLMERVRRLQEQAAQADDPSDQPE